MRGPNKMRVASRAAGLCDRCHKAPAYDTCTKCEPCMVRERARRAEKRREAEQVGMCVVCFKRPQGSYSKKCDECYAKASQHNVAYRKALRWQQELKAQQSGKCVQCLANPCAPRRRRCPQCLELNRKREERLETAAGIRRNAMKPQGGTACDLSARTTRSPVEAAREGDEAASTELHYATQWNARLHGMCIACFENPCRPGRVRCDGCLQRGRALKEHLEHRKRGGDAMKPPSE